ncbi:hypothetical protein PPGU19_001370 [Paraburkholderia sp. PGU19]|uniref:hypothetical protein n=1 Tax=Paraburkholderia sp. PGU19 TaxID=2735434 RepID=UPI0015D9D1C7|nr:hypothetical protein [Paraburkholderia sp. PGU19]BCF95568.1 hypothetical protein PPGU19_001370 [Paraburkholderia sp. PGU19]
MSAYIKQLNRMLQTTLPTQSPLRQQFENWYGSLPEIVRNRPFSMVEFEVALDTQGKYISAVLLDLGWRRKRRWNTRGQYHRYWEPPAPACEEHSR